MNRLENDMGEFHFHTKTYFVSFFVLLHVKLRPLCVNTPPSGGFSPTGNTIFN